MNNLEDAHEQIDTAISTALKESKPVYISIGCNLPGIPHPTFSRDPVPFSLSAKYVLFFCPLLTGLWRIQLWEILIFNYFGLGGLQIE